MERAPTGVSQEIPPGTDQSASQREETARWSRVWETLNVLHGGVHLTEKGTPIGRGDTLSISREAGLSEGLSAARQRRTGLPARTSQHTLVSAARKRGMRVVEPVAEGAASSVRRGPMTGEAKRALIKKTRSYRKDVEKWK